MQLITKIQQPCCSLNSILSVSDDPEKVKKRVNNAKNCLDLFLLASLEADSLSQVALAKAYCLIEGDKDISAEEAVTKAYRRVFSGKLPQEICTRYAQSVIKKATAQQKYKLK